MLQLILLGSFARTVRVRTVVAARDNRMTLVIPRYGRDHFLAPGFRKAADSCASLMALYAQIAGVLTVADAVIDLDQAAGFVAAEAPSQPSVHA